MSGPVDWNDGALWRRWQAVASSDAPDFMTLAAYADGRLDAQQRAAVERLLALDSDIRAAVDPDIDDAQVSDAAVARTIERATALVAAPAASNVVAFTARPVAVRRLTEWAALAASIALVSWLGFALGTNTYSALAIDPAASSDIHDVFDPPSSFFAPFLDQSGT